MKKYLISLAKDSERRTLFFSQPNTADFYLFDAINTMQLEKAALRVRFDFEAFQAHYGRAVTKGEIGCTLSHLGVYQLIVDDETIGEDEYALVCEDDCLFAPNFQITLDALLAEKPSADMVLVGQSKILKFDDSNLKSIIPPLLLFGVNLLGILLIVMLTPIKIILRERLPI